MSSLTCPFPIEGRVITGPHGGLSGGVLIGHCSTIWVGIEQEEWLEVTSDTFWCHIFPLGANLDIRYWLQEYVNKKQEVQVSESSPHLEKMCKNCTF